MDIEPLRARRRRLTETVARRRLAIAQRDRTSYLSFRPGDEPRWIRRATSPYFWATLTPRCCGCTKRTHGAPRRDKGMCCLGARRRIYQWRAEARALKQGHYEED